MNKELKVAFMCHPYHRGGVTRWMADAAMAMSARGTEVYFVTVDPSAPFYSGKGREKMVDMLKGGGVNLHVVKAPAGYEYEFGTEGYRAKIYAGLVAKNVPAGTPVILSDDASVWAGAAWLADKYPMVGVIHGNDDIYYRNAGNFGAQLSLCVCVSDRLRKNLLTNCPGVAVEKVRVIPCGINLPVFAPASREDGVLGLIFIGRIEDKVKRATDLVQICWLLKEKGIAFHLDIIGNGEASGKEFAASFADAGVGEQVTFHGWKAKPEIQQLLNRADVLLLTSNSEGMPLVMMEALASGCGFTGTRVSGIEDYEFHRLAKDCFSVYTIGDIDDAVTKIMNVAAVAPKTRAQSARKLAEEEFGMDVCLGKYQKVLSTAKPVAEPARNVKLSPFDLISSRVLAWARYWKVRSSGR